MSKMEKIKKYLRNPRKIILFLSSKGLLSFLSDRQYIKLIYRTKFHKRIDLENPKTYNEKLQWIKLHDHQPIYKKMVDKYEVKSLVAGMIGNQYIIPTYGVWDRFDDIDFSLLPDQFVLKCTHDSNGLIICKDKSKLDLKTARKKISRCLKTDYYKLGREWPYKGIPRRIIAEKYMVDESAVELKDYKVMCFNGEPKLIELHTGRFTDHQTQDFYDTDWNRTTISQSGIDNYQINPITYPRPSTLEEMIELSRVLSKGIPHVRVDWYSVNGKLYFGELTFFDGSGLDPYDDPNDDLMLGSWITLPEATD